METCAAEAKTTQGYCETHGCTHGSCNAARKPGTNYCSDHCCHSGGCRHEASRKKGFCRQHACDIKDCGLPKLGGHECIDLCVKHLPEHIRRQTESKYGREAQLREADLQEKLHEYEQRDKIRRAMDEEEERLNLQASLDEERQWRRSAEAKKSRIEEEIRQAKENDRINAAAARLAEQKLREQKREERDRQQREAEEEDRAAYERAERRRAREREEWEREREREREAWWERERQEEAERRMRDRLRRPADEFRHVPLGRRGMRRDSYHEW